MSTVRLQKLVRLRHWGFWLRVSGPVNFMFPGFGAVLEVWVNICDNFFLFVYVTVGFVLILCFFTFSLVIFIICCSFCSLEGSRTVFVVFLVTSCFNLKRLPSSFTFVVFVLWLSALLLRWVLSLCSFLLTHPHLDRRCSSPCDGAASESVLKLHARTVGLMFCIHICYLYRSGLF